MDILINHNDPYVRAIVAYQGYGLDILINDKKDFVRAEVAKQGYCLDILVNDESECVRLLAHCVMIDKLGSDKNEVERQSNDSSNKYGFGIRGKLNKPSI